MRRSDVAFFGAGLLIFLAWVASLWAVLGARARVPRVETPVAAHSFLPRDTLSLTYVVLAGGQEVATLSYVVRPHGRGGSLSWKLSPLRSGPVPSPMPLVGEGFTTLSDEGVLTRFHVTFQLGAQRLEATGVREGDVLVVRGQGLGMSINRVVPVDTSLALSQGVVPGWMAGCPGLDQRWVWRVFDPFSSTEHEVAMEREPGRVDPPAPPGGCVAAVSYRDMKVLMWVDRHGIVVRQRLPVGLELVLTSPPLGGRAP